jgi:hypothetical protein
MSSALQYPHILEETGQSARLERWPRVRVAQIVMDHVAHSWTADDIARQYPHLSLSEIHSALAYYFDHQDQIDTEIREELHRANEGAAAARRSPLAIRLAALAR